MIFNLVAMEIITTDLPMQTSTLPLSTEHASMSVPVSLSTLIYHLVRMIDIHNVSKLSFVITLAIIIGTKFEHNCHYNF